MQTFKAKSQISPRNSKHGSRASDEFQVIHHLPCRYRIFVRSLKDQPEKAAWTEIQLARSVGGVTAVKASSKTGNILIETTTEKDPAALINIVAHQLAALGDFKADAPGLAGRKKKKLKKLFVNEQLRLLPFTNWYSTTLTKIRKDLATDEGQGLQNSERQSRLTHYGTNSYHVSSKIEHIKIIKDQLFNFPTGMLLGSTVLSLITGSFIDAALIMVVVGLNGSIGFRTSLSAERAINSLGELVREPVQVLINGLWHRVQAKELVPGDIIRLEGGIVPADCVVIESDGLTTDESSITGESNNRYKYCDTMPEDTPIADRHNMLFAGTISTGGSGKAVVVETGRSTEMGKITSMTAGINTRNSLLQNQLDELGTKTVTLASALCAGFFVTGILRGTSFIEMLRTSISLAVAAIPEGLTAVGTISFAFGIGRMQRKRIYARDLRSIENLGNVHYFCLDKTGTVTANRMVVDSVFIDGENRPLAELSFHAGQDDSVSELIKVAVLCNDAKLDEQDETKRSGSPTEIALLELAAQLGFDIINWRSEHPRQSTTYRAIDRRYMTTRHKHADGTLITIKGDPSKVLKKCRTALSKGQEVTITDELRQDIQRANKDMADQGLRVLGLGKYIANGDEDGNDFCWLGLVAISDPPRVGVKGLIERLHQAGIKTMLVTGDQLPTAISVAKELGFNGKSDMNALDAKTLHALSHESQHEVIADTQVFARVSPEEKLVIVRILQEKGFIVAMTGDGVNDSPALRAADIGIAMGKSGSVAARETADVVIGDDRLQTMIDAIIEGRSIRKNLKQATRFLLATNYAEMASMIIGLLVKGRSVLSPVQLLWMNMITDVFPALAMAARPANDILGNEAPPSTESQLFSQEESSQMLRDAIIMAASSLPHFFIKDCTDRDKGSGISEFLTTLVTSQMAYALSLNGRQKPSNGQESNHQLLVYATLAATLLTQIALPSIPGLARLLGLNHMTFKRTAASITLGVVPVLAANGLNELLKQRGSSH